MDFIKNLISKINLDFRNIAINFDDKAVWLIVLILAILILSCIISYLLSGSFLGNYWRVFVAPGVILHELSHAFFCLITGAKITKMSFFEKNGGHVEHTESKLPILGQIIISIAPLFVGAIAIYFISKIIGIKIVPITLDNLSLSSMIDLGKQSVSAFDLHSIKFWVLIYLALSVAVTMTPSVKDISNIALFSILIIVVVFAVYRIFHLNINFSNFVPEQAIIFFSATIVLLILALVLSIILFALSKVIKAK